MARMIIAAASEKVREQLSRLLASSGYNVFRVCASGGELRRTLGSCEDGIVIIAGGLPDSPTDELAEDFRDSFQFLLVGRPDTLAACESPRVFRLNYPCPGSAVTGALEMLSQLHAMGLPKRSAGDRELVEQAKALLMREYGLTEPEAHRMMQRSAMRRNVKMTEYAIWLLQGGTEDA